jgi:hypothetical protein
MKKTNKSNQLELPNPRPAEPEKGIRDARAKRPTLNRRKIWAAIDGEDGERLVTVRDNSFYRSGEKMRVELRGLEWVDVAPKTNALLRGGQ